MIRAASCALFSLAFAAAPAYAQTVVDIPTIQQETTLILRGEGKVDLKPDFGTIYIGVSSLEHKTPGEAMNDLNGKMANVVGALKKAGIADRDLKTSNLTLNPVWEYPGAGKPARVIGYIAVNRVTAKIKSMDKMGPTIDAAVAAGSNNIYGPSFGVDNDAAPQKEARGLAIRDAMSKAQDYASAMGYRVTRIVNVAEPNARGPTAPLSDRVVVTGSRIAGGGAPTVVEPGEVLVQQWVDVTFELVK